MTNEDDTRREIGNGEGSFLEFKSTLRWNIKAGRDDPAITLEVLKTAAAFLNSEGGVLLIGVSDTGSLLGIAVDHFKNDDHFLVSLYEYVKTALGPDAAPYIEAKIRDVDGVKVCRAVSKPSPKPVFVNFHTAKDAFFIRTGPVTTQLPASKIYIYIKEHWETNQTPGGRATPQQQAFVQLLEIADLPRAAILRFQREVQRLRKAGKIANIGMNLPPEYDSAAKAFHDSISTFEERTHVARRWLSEKDKDLIDRSSTAATALLELESAIRHDQVIVEKDQKFVTASRLLDEVADVMTALLTGSDEETRAKPAAPMVRITTTNGTIHNLVASTVGFRINEGTLGHMQRSIRICANGATNSYDISNFSQLLGPARRGFTDCCSPKSHAEQITVTIRGGGNITGYVVDTCDQNGAKSLALTGVDPSIKNTLTINFSSIGRVELA
jgi:hypothetical protein